MIYLGAEKENATESILKEAGFTVSQKCCCRPSCFDFAARKNRTIFFIKIQPDIGQVSPHNSLELRVMSEYFSAAPLMISEKAREKPLEEDTVYSRYNILAVTQKTFENIILRQNYPLIQAGPGGYYVEIDGDAIKRRRHKLGLSVGELAEMMGISRRTLYGYERGMGKASVSTAYSLICTLGIPIAKPMHLFQKSKNQPKRFLTAAKYAITRNKLLRRIFRKLHHYNTAAFRKAPFDFIINLKEERMKIIGGIASRKERDLSRRVDEILSVSRVVRAHPILITEGQKSSNTDIPCIRSEELSRIKNTQDLIANIK